MTEERLAALEALYRRTTPEVWAYDLGDYVVAKPDTTLHDWIPIADLYEGGPAHIDPIANGEWIADMHGAFGELLGDWRRLHVFEEWLRRFKAHVAETEKNTVRDRSVIDQAILIDRGILIRQIEDVLAGKWGMGE